MNVNLTDLNLLLWKFTVPEFNVMKHHRFIINVNYVPKHLRFGVVIVIFHNYELPFLFWPKYCIRLS